MFVYLNGSIVKKEQATISAFDHGYMYGVGLFETFRVDHGHPFLLDDHFQRLQKGLASVGIKWDMTRDEACSIIQRLLDANGLKDAYVRWNVSAGVQDLGLYTGDYLDPVTIVYMKELPPTPGEKDARILTIPRNTPEGTERLKSHHYLNNLLAKRELGNDGTVEGIFLTGDGFIAEGIVSNVFWVKGGTVYTPSLDTGILNGVTRQFILQLLEKNKINYREGLFQLGDLLEADEMFVTNSIQEIVSIRTCEGRIYKRDSELVATLRQAIEEYRNVLWSRVEIKEDE